MKTQPLKSKYDYPPRQRRLAVHAWLVILLGIMAAAIFLMSCSPRMGCPSHNGMSGYGWIKCKETNKVFILRSDGSIKCTYYDTK